MALDLRRAARRSHGSGRLLVGDLQKLEAAVGSCFQGAGYLQREATVFAICLAAKFASGAAVNVDLEPEGWRLSPDCSDAPADEKQPNLSLETLVQVSYKRDYDSQRARVALRRRPAEASDVFFEAHDDDKSDISPALARFRQRSEFQLIGV